MSFFSFFKLSTVTAMIAFGEKVGPVLAEEVPVLVSAVKKAIASKGAPGTVANVSGAVTKAAAELGLSSEDQSNVQAYAAGVAGFTPVLDMLAESSLPASTHAVIKAAAVVLSDAASGILAAAPAALPVALAPAV